MIHCQAEFSANNPAVIGDAFFFDLVGTATFSDRMNQFNDKSVNNT